MRFWKPKDVPGTPRVGLAVAAYVENEDGREAAALRCLVASVQAQTYQDWRVTVTHDGEYLHHPAMLDYFSQWDREPRVEVVETPVRKECYGHPHRQTAIHRLLGDGCEWIGLTNQDNYYAPVYFEWLLSEAARKKAPFVYCDWVSSHKQWKPRVAEIRRGHIDLGCFLAHRSVVEKVKFDKTDFAADWDYIARLVQAAGGRVAKVAAPLFVHN